MELFRVGIKFLAEETGAVSLQEFIPVFHSWIQGGRLDELLIDVADYSHVPEGPGIVLVAHEGNYAYDESGGRRGLVYYSKRPLTGDLPARLATVCRRALAAGALLEGNDAFNGRLRFRGDRVEIFANDRLLAPNTAATRDALKEPVASFLRRLYDCGEYDLTTEPDPNERFSLYVTAKTPVSISALAERLS